MNYEEDWLERYKNPGYKEIFASNKQTSLSNSSCGDMIEIMLDVRGGKVVKARFEGRGCVMSTASADMLCEMSEDKESSEIMAMDESEWISRFRDLSPGRYNCVLLALRAMKEALNGSR